MAWPRMAKSLQNLSFLTTLPPFAVNTGRTVPTLLCRLAAVGVTVLPLPATFDGVEKSKVCRLREVVFEGLRMADVMGLLDAKEGSYAYCLIRCIVVELWRGTISIAYEVEESKKLTWPEVE